MWVLVLIIALNANPAIEKIGTYESMEKCFDARDNILVEYGSYDGLFITGLQAVCVQYK